MMKRLFFTLFVFFSIYTNAQNWQTFTDSIPTLSSPRSTDLNGDGVMDVVIGGGTDSVFSDNGIMAYNGVDGSLLWKRSSRDEVFGSAIFQDITSDGINDVIIVGRSAQLLAIDGTNGTLLWDYFPYSTNPADSGLFNFYNPQFIHDIDGDTYPDILVANGGDHTAPAWQSNRPPGHLMVVSALTGNLIIKAVVPDSSEIYCSPIVADIQNTGNKWVLYGTGGENFGGNFYAVLLSDLLLGNITGSIILASDLNKGFIAPAAIHKTDYGTYDIIIQSFDGLVTKIAGQTFSPIWTYQKPGTESSAEPVIGNFTGDLTPDVLLVLFKGTAPSYNDYYQVMLDGNDGTVSFLDSLGAINFSSSNSVDLNNDGRDEGLYSITYLDGGYFKNRVESIDFTTNTINTLDQTRTGVNIGSTPLITDLDNDGLLDLIYSVKKDSLNPMGWKGIYVYRHELTSIVPNSGIAWGSYLGTNMDGVYNSELVDCGNSSVISSVNATKPCNGFTDGNINVNLIGNGFPYTYLWSNQSTNASIQNLATGSYWVQVTDSMGCYELRTINLVDRYATGFGGIIPNTCSNDSNGTATVGSSGCQCMTSNCTYLWDNGVTIKNNFTLTTGWNSVIITHADGCVVVDSVLINSINQADTSYTNISVCDDSLVWNGTTYDSSGTYSYRGSTTSNNYSMSFDGSGDYINNIFNSPLSLNGDFCIQGWWYKATGSANNPFWCIGDVKTGGLELYVGDGGTVTKVYHADSTTIVAAFNPTVAAWHHYSVVRESGIIKLYIDGIQDPNTWNSTATFSGDLNIGQEIYNGSNVYNTWCDGFIDNFEIWDIALTQQEIQQYMNCPPIGNETGLISYWNFEQGSGTITYDQTVNGNNGTINGATYNTNVPAQSCGLTNTNGCDSTAVLNLTINYLNTGASAVTVCSTYIWNNQSITQSGSYDQTFTNATGCDSVHTLTLTINPSTTSTSAYTTCDNYLWNGTTYTSSGSYSYTTTNSNGCDSIATLNLTINTSTTSTSIVIECDTYSWNGTTYTASGTYTYSTTNSNGCDSIATLNLTINNSTSGASSVTACDSYTWDGVTYTTSGVHSNTYTNAAGCDSVHILDLTVNDIHVINNIVDICYGDTFIVGNSIYTSSGTYTDLLTSVNGCDSIITTNLTVASQVIATVSQVGLDLDVSAVGGNTPYSYQWNTTQITQQITPIANGNYWVIVEDINQCISDTIYFNVTWISTDITEFDIVDLSIYPNPSEDIFNITFTSKEKQNLQLRVLNMLGEEIYTENLESFVGNYNKQIMLGKYPDAIYLLEIKTSEGIVNRKLMLQ
ncbi:MAG: LamG-like jellyroll fold domain-containing protein [Bacteroidota bacterium]|nr:LamG-like jellyroll fold domain-containing protein [Bacteroidota bacterium]